MAKSFNKKLKKKNMVFISAGDNTNFDILYVNELMEYDIYVIYYGNNETIFNKYKSRVTFIEMRKGSKFQNFRYFYDRYKYIIDYYDYFFILDDDIIFKYNDINDMFSISKKYNLSICGPSFKEGSKISHKITKQKKNIILTYTNFVEVNSPLFNKQSLNNLMKYLHSELIGWGIDYLYIYCNGFKRRKAYAIIHNIGCVNPENNNKSNKRELLLIKNCKIRKLIWERYADRIRCPRKYKLCEYEDIVINKNINDDIVINKSITENIVINKNINDNIVIRDSMDNFLKKNLKIYDILVINLERRKDRLKYMKFKLKNQGIHDYQIFKAVDGYTSENKKIYNNINKNQGNINSNGAVGHLLTYRKITTKYINDKNFKDNQKILLLEDDIYFHKEFNKLIKNHLTIINNCDIVYVGATQHRWENIKFTDSYYNVVKKYPIYGTFCIILNKKILKLINNELSCNPINYKYTTDYLLWKLIHKHNLNAKVIFPNLVIADVSESDNMGPRNMNLLSKKLKWNIDNYKLTKNTN